MSRCRDVHPAVQIKKEHPDWTQERIGNALWITGQAVSLQLIKAGIRTRKSQLCVVCWDRVTKKNRARDGICLKCYHEKHTELLTCELCGRVFERKLSQVKRSRKSKSKHTWCSKLCQGKWFAAHYGFGAVR